MIFGNNSDNDKDVDADISADVPQSSDDSAVTPPEKLDKPPTGEEFFVDNIDFSVEFDDLPESGDQVTNASASNTVKPKVVQTSESSENQTNPDTNETIDLNLDVDSGSPADEPLPGHEEEDSHSDSTDLVVSQPSYQGGELRTISYDVSQRGEANTQRISGRFGDQLVETGLITESQLNVALQEKKTSKKMLGEICVELGFLSEEDLTAFLAKSSGYQLFDPKATIVDGNALSILDKKTALKHNILPVSFDEQDLVVAMADPYDVMAMDALRRYMPKGFGIKPIVATASVINEAIDAAYGYASSINAILKELEENGEQEEDLSQLSENQSFSHPIVRLVNALVFDAVKAGVSDLHFEPEENFIRLRYRKDGVLYTAQILHKQHWNGISQRLKIMSNMNIADKLSPQDGRFNLNVGGKEADFRVSSLPTVHGENIVLRVLDKSASIMPMSALGFSEENLEKIKIAQSKPEGIIIVTGPTGSGKTTSLYSMLNEINDVEVNIQTLEDPVEYSLPMIRQTHVREGVLTFADGIKALLRQDPDIIFIGEVRDAETANMALKAAMTGHQVYSTLHTNDSFGAIPRLLDLNLKPGMLAGALIAIFAQRLARRLCSNCKEEYTPDQKECELLGVSPADAPRIYRARQGGCSACSGMGYKGRVAVVEILTFDEEINEAIANGANKADIKHIAVKKGFKSMKDDGILKIKEGITDFDALSRVVHLDKS